MPDCDIHNMRLKALEEDCGRIGDAVYGNGKPGIVTEIAVIKMQLKTIIGMLVPIMLSIVGMLVQQFFGK